VRGVSKHFQVRGERVPPSRRLRERGDEDPRILEVLKDVNFEVGQGEFFGIVGRNGSGKSTLLKLLASVYRADAGRIRVAGRLAPFLELGVGFNPQLAARENVILNAVMMGLTPEEARNRSDEAIDFAGLREFTDMPLKHYSSGMKVRLAFSALTQVDADVLLLDEVLAVGDAEFRQRCEMVFEEMRREGRTIVLVTHNMDTVNAFCDRAMLINAGAIEAIGAPAEVASRYTELNARAVADARAGGEGSNAAQFADVIADPPIRITGAWINAGSGPRKEVIDEREPIELHLEAEVLRHVDTPGIQFRITDRYGRVVFLARALDSLEGVAPPGERLRVHASIENRLAPGVYTLNGGLTQRRGIGEYEPAALAKPLTFEVLGTDNGATMSLEHEIVLETLTDVSIQREQNR
jgi:ABC-2 type transport system ATP-binding protein